MSSKKNTQTVINDALVKLQSVANDDEAATVERLAVEAGYWWRCDEDSCHGYVNNADDRRCGNCGKNR